MTLAPDREDVRRRRRKPLYEVVSEAVGRGRPYYETHYSLDLAKTFCGKVVDRPADDVDDGATCTVCRFLHVEGAKPSPYVVRTPT